MLTEKQQQIFDETFGMKQSRLNMYAAVEAVLADQGADLNAKYVQGFEDCRAQAMNVVDEHDGFLQRIEFLKPAPIAEQARAAEQGQKRSSNENQSDVCMVRPVDRGVLGQEKSNPVPVSVADGCAGNQITQPAGDVVERMCGDYGNLTGTDPDPVAMAAALAVAREGYVSLEDVREVVRAQFIEDKFDSENYTAGQFWANAKKRLTKPAEQTDEQKVEAVPQKRSLAMPGTAAWIVAVLRDGKEGK